MASANNIVDEFLSGKTDKGHTPNLGTFFASNLLSGSRLSSQITSLMAKEGISRNIKRSSVTGDPRPGEYECLEVNDTDYGREDFEAGKTAYQVLMPRKLSLDMFCDGGQSLEQIREQLFDKMTSPEGTVLDIFLDEVVNVMSVDSIRGFKIRMGISEAIELPV
ncbi:hypothetical protein BCR34DRAFT_619276 [Clohesyomyces aquaticus]|uniref:Uncharacterized protein n=1 Tax=Clohesyomyces aquaticus TaxID=1231657 RepID=A0A1Y1YJD7_9PLEO|nr:hypothetical protein BCR34DRAFT_619276 [Clohesyomyces aquaticus]